MKKTWTAVAENYGLRKPYNFRIAIPFLLNLMGFILVFLVCVFFFASRNLNIGTERFYFFLYVALLLLTGAAFSRITVPSLVFFFWCAAELSLALVSSELERRGITNSLFPQNRFTTTEDPRFEHHPVLGMTPKPNSQGEWHVNRRNAALSKQNGWAVNPSFFADNIFHHNSLGLRGRELSTNDLKKELIFVYGGSSTYDYNVTQGSTWVEQLEADLDHKFIIVNFGVIVHSTTQHLVHTAFYQNILQKKPICAAYYVGWNDSHNAHVPNLDPAYANGISLIINMFVRRELWAAKYSPIVSLIDNTAVHRFANAPEFPARRGADPGNISDPRLERIFVEHIEAIIAINNARGIKSVFIGQVMNREMFPRWPIVERLNAIMESTSTSLGAKYIDAGISNFDNDDFADAGHFSAGGSKKFAGLIAKRIESDCQ